MNIAQNASRLVCGALLGGVAVGALVAATERTQAGAVAEQGSASRVERAPAQARVPVADEYYPVKTDWISPDRSIHTIRHGPTGSCYILVYPSGESLMPVEKDRCTSVPGPVEK